LMATGKITKEFVMRVYFQIVMALAVEYHEFDFTHYDLHAGNVLIQATPGNRFYLIPYTFEGRTVYIKTNVIVKIIDYGLSH
ncbi:hypothetical protein DF186_22380, partial [Enterococcus hirae]